MVEKKIGMVKRNMPGGEHHTERHSGQKAWKYVWKIVSSLAGDNAEDEMRVIGRKVLNARQEVWTARPESNEKALQKQTTL